MFCLLCISLACTFYVSITRSLNFKQLNALVTSACLYVDLHSGTIITPQFTFSLISCHNVDIFPLLPAIELLGTINTYRNACILWLFIMEAKVAREKL